MQPSICPNCGATLRDLKCEHCGTDWSPPPSNVPPPRTSPQAIAALSLVLPSLLLIAVPWLGIVTAGLGAFFGFDALREIRRHPERWKGRIVAAIGFAVCAICLLIMLALTTSYRF